MNMSMWPRTGCVLKGKVKHNVSDFSHQHQDVYMATNFRSSVT